MYFCHLCLFPLSSNGVRSLGCYSQREPPACDAAVVLSLLDLFVGALTLTRSLRGSSRSTASRDKSAAPLSAGGVRGSRCNLGSQIQIYDSSPAVTRVPDNETLTSFIGLLCSCPFPADYRGIIQHFFTSHSVFRPAFYLSLWICCKKPTSTE